MYSKAILTRYADTLEGQDSERLKKEIGAIQFEKDSDICVAIEGENAFVRAGIAHLYADLNDRLSEFVGEEDMQDLQKLIESFA